jgi:hypothetical protein
MMKREMRLKNRFSKVLNRLIYLFVLNFKNRVQRSWSHFLFFRFKRKHLLPPLSISEDSPLDKLLPSLRMKKKMNQQKEISISMETRDAMGCDESTCCLRRDLGFDRLMSEVSEDDPGQKVGKERLKCMLRMSPIFSMNGMAACILAMGSIITSIYLRYHGTGDFFFDAPISRLGYGNREAAIMFRVGVSVSMVMLTAYGLFLWRLLSTSPENRIISTVGLLMMILSGLGVTIVVSFPDPTRADFMLHVAGGAMYILCSSIGGIALTVCLCRLHMLTVLHHVFFLACFVSGILVALTGVPAVMAGGPGNWLTMSSGEREKRFDEVVRMSPSFSRSQWVYIISSLCWYTTTTTRTLLLTFALTRKQQRRK